MNYDLMRRLQEEPSEEHLWDMILSYQNIMFKTYSGLPFTYEAVSYTHLTLPTKRIV